MECAMAGFSNYVDIVALRQQEQYGLNGQRLGVCRGRLRKLDKWTLKNIIVEQLKVCGGTFDMHKLPRIVEDKLDIKWDPKKFRFESLRAIFEDADIKKICRLDNASSTALVSTPEKSKEAPTMEFIKNGFVAVLQKYDPHQEG